MTYAGGGVGMIMFFSGRIGWIWTALIDDPAAQCLGDGFGFGMDMQLVEYVASVIAGCMNADFERVGSPLVGVPFHEQS